jgi:methylglutaconyl-CoA hydratase
MTQVLLSSDTRGVATVTLNRPELHNAFDDRMIAELTGVLTKLGADSAVRIVVLAANGKSFSAGADLGWMKRMATYSEAENLKDARALGALMRTLDAMPKPTLALVQGPAYGGGVGLVACCDIAIAADTASFSLSEARLGLIPAVISPYVVRAIGARACRRYFLTAERFDVAEAHRLGLVHLVAPVAGLAETGEKMLRTLLDAGPAAQMECKSLIARVSDQPVDETMVDDTAQRIARLRASPEGKEGVAAFLGKRKAAWVKG